MERGEKQKTHLELQPMVGGKASLYRPKMPEKNHEGRRGVVRKTNQDEH